jgi:glycerol kinase
MDLFLAIDQSTSGTKALLFQPDGVLLAASSVSHRQIYPTPGWVEHDAEEIYRNLRAAVSDLLQKNPQAVERIGAVSITNQRETFVIFERGSGRPLHNAIVWQCRRGEPVCRRLLEQGHGEMVQNATGLLIDTYFPASKILWLLEERPDLRQKVNDGSALISTIDAYLVYRLTGGREFATDHTNASRTLLYDISRLDWHPDLCDLFGVPRHALPQVRESRDYYGETDFDGLLPGKRPIYGVIGDSQSALFAQRCFSPGSVKVTFGTGSSILMNLGEQRRTAGHGIVTALAWVIDGQPTYAYEGITNFTGATIQWLRDQLQLIQTAEETEALALSVQNNAGVYLVPAFVGLSAPYWQPQARAGILGLTPGATRAHVVRAALESIAYTIHDALQFMSSEAGMPLGYIHADGGAVRNRFLMQFVADITRVGVRAAKVPELSALGAVLSGALGKGIYRSTTELQDLPADFVEYTPKISETESSRYKAGWANAIQQILSSAHKE